MRRQRAEIYWGDETGVRNDCQHSRGYAPRGQTPVVAVNAKRFSLNMISAINNLGLLRFLLYEQTMTVRVLLKFMNFIVRLLSEPSLTEKYLSSVSLVLQGL